MGYGCDQDAPEVVQFGDRQQNARKEHRCETCLLGGPPGTNTIPVGQRYRRITGTIDGELFTYRECVGPCPHTAPCPSCKGLGVINGDGIHADPCPGCDGCGKVRAALTERAEP